MAGILDEVMEGLKAAKKETEPPPKTEQPPKPPENGGGAPPPPASQASAFEYGEQFKEKYGERKP
jgi:hypothetical protein